MGKDVNEFYLHAGQQPTAEWIQQVSELVF